MYGGINLTIKYNMLKIFIPNINKIINNIDNNNKFLTTLVIEFLPQIIIVLFFSFILSYTHVFILNERMIKSEQHFNHSITVDNVSFLSNSIFNDYRSRFESQPLISYFRDFDLNNINKQYYKKTNENLNIIESKFYYSDGSRNSINIDLKGFSNNKIKKKEFEIIIENIIYNNTFPYIADEINLNKSMLETQILDIDEIVRNERKNLGRVVSNFVNNTINPAIQSDIQDLCTDQSFKISNYFREILKCENQYLEFIPDKANFDFYIEDVKLDKQYTLKLLYAVLEKIVEFPNHTFSFDQIFIFSNNNSKSYMVFFIYYFLSLFIIFLIIFNFVILFNYHKIHK